MKSDKELREKYSELQMIHQQIKYITEHVQEINSKMVELDYIKTSLSELKRVGKGAEVLAPISSGIFIKAKLQSPEDLVVNVGQNTVVPKTVEEAKELLSGQVNEIETVRMELLAQLNELSNMGQRLEDELKHMSGKNV